MEINYLDDLNSLRSAPELSKVQIKQLLEELEAKIIDADWITIGIMAPSDFDAIAALKSICFQTKDLFTCLIKDTGLETKDFVMRVDGGMSRNNLMMQYLSDILRIKIERPVNQESTATGAAYLAGLQSGLYKNIAELEYLWKTDKVFEPTDLKDQVNDEYNCWLDVVKKEMG